LLFDEHGIIGGHDLGSTYSGFDKQMLIAVTETCSRSAIDRLVDGLRRITA
jgi:hypothetical protein